MELSQPTCHTSQTGYYYNQYLLLSLRTVILQVAAITSFTVSVYHNLLIPEGYETALGCSVTTCQWCLLLIIIVATAATTSTLHLHHHHHHCHWRCHDT